MAKCFFANKKVGYHTSSNPNLIGLRTSSSHARNQVDSSWDDLHDFTILKEWKSPFKQQNGHHHTIKEDIQLLRDMNSQYHQPRLFTLPMKKGEEAQNCVKFETHKSNYLVELIEGILPKEIIQGSKILVKMTESSFPNIIFINFSTAVKAYQADQFMQQWNEYTPPTNKIKSTLIKKSLDPLYTITHDSIESLPEYPVPKNITVITNEKEVESKTIELLLDGEKPMDIQLLSKIELGMDFDWYHKNITSDEQTFYVLTLCNDDNCVVYNLESIGCLPPILEQIISSRTIVKVGYNHKMESTKFEKQFNVKLNAYDDLSKTPIVMRSKPKTLRSVAGLFLKQKIPKSEVHRYSTSLSSLFTDKKIQHYAQKAHCAKTLYYVLESDKVDFQLRFEEGDHLIDYIEDD
ncbi:hypothetical protein PPL_01720 [Heterostelium album PN500]|uniref:3'-5' exonuclease domain-containing protein n=1 Tax=Heterostelium pallidum (strain ATCC 26659 / Pp 5 / PN500) TaxID=670386 RepID=D3B0A4_HETP5|nr:hypothetical protein PPL_01720 [Heterostelium album PN500]EFA84728.1 hypothetical protein PPL_01720 [Heterostelium album PN500]|eukprot:XP_020436840.1 hypothetical protein PPL_01720 [Heterostelium album PN500]